MIARPRLFVTDGSYPNALAAVRTLGRNNFSVTVGESVGVSFPRSIASWSRHCASTLRYPDPQRAPEACAASIAEHFRQKEYDAAIPVGLSMVDLFVRYRDLFPVRTMLPPNDSFDIAADKRLTFDHATSLGFPTPRTVLAKQWHTLELPVVFKHPHTGVLAAVTAEEAAVHAEQLGPNLDKYVAQEYIPGRNGFGYFGLFENGREIGYFMHERLMQFPREGGVSVVARAIRNSRLHELGRSLLESLNWHGPAMVEFKRSERDGEFYLIEINPKLWGSLDLAIQSGCNFPVWIAQWIISGAAPKCLRYRENITYQWVVPNGLKCFLLYPEFRLPFLRNVLTPGVRTDLSCFDPLPSVAGLLTMFLHRLRR